jgi:hypothetical protein
VTPASVQLCTGNSTTLTAASSAGGTLNYYWTPGGSNTAAITVSPTSSTVYTVAVSNSDNSVLIGTATASVTVNPIPVTQTINVTSTSICSNSSTVFSLAGSVVGTSYLLQTNPSVGVGTLYARTNGTGNLVTFASVSPKVTTTYWVIATNAFGCPLILGSTGITVNPLPATSAITGPGSVSAGATGVAYSVTATGGSTYGWTVPAGSTFTGGTGNAITVHFSSTSGNVTVTETNASGCNGTAITKAVTVNPLSSVAGITISGTSINYTGGSASQFVLLSATNLMTIPSAWTPLFTNLSTPGSFTIPPVGTASQIYYRIKSQ